MPGLLPHAGLKRRRKAQGTAAAAAAGEESAPEAGGQALVPYNPEASQKAEGDPEETGPGSEAQRSSSRGLRVQQRLFENGFLAAKMSRARMMHTLMAQLVGAFLLVCCYLWLCLLSACLLSCSVSSFVDGLVQDGIAACWCHVAVPGAQAAARCQAG